MMKGGGKIAGDASRRRMEPDMEQRLDFTKASPGAYRAMLGLEAHLRDCGLERRLLDLVRLRASQINGCAFCIDMHWKDLRAQDESEQRLYGLDAWQESPYYSDRERAALLWTEALTLVREDRVPDEVFREVRARFDDKEIADLTLCVAAINPWNRIEISTRAVPGRYR